MSARLANLGSKPLGLIALGPLFTVIGLRAMLDAGGALMLLTTLVAGALVVRATRRHRAGMSARKRSTAAGM